MSSPPHTLRTPALALALSLLIVVGSGPGIAEAADTPAGDLQIVASGLTNPRGFTWNANGALLVTLAGSGGANPGVPRMRPPMGPFQGGFTAAVAIVERGCPVPALTGFPSVRDGRGTVFGAEGVAVLGSQLFVLSAAGGAVHGLPNATTGIYRVEANGTATLVADYAAWLAQHPPAALPPEGYPNPGRPVAMVSGLGRLWIVDALNGLVVSMTPNGALDLVADLSGEKATPAAIAISPDGGLYVGTLTRPPYAGGYAKVFRVEQDGTWIVAWDGLTAISGVAVAPDGELYAAEMSTGNSLRRPHLNADSGRIVRRASSDTVEVLAEGLSYPVGLAFGPDGALYTSVLGRGSSDGAGMVARLDPDGQAVAGAPPECAPIPATLASG